MRYREEGNWADGLPAGEDPNSLHSGTAGVHSRVFAVQRAERPASAPRPRLHHVAGFRDEAVLHVDVAGPRRGAEEREVRLLHRHVLRRPARRGWERPHVDGAEEDPSSRREGRRGGVAVRGEAPRPALRRDRRRRLRGAGREADDGVEALPGGADVAEQQRPRPDAHHLLRLRVGARARLVAGAAVAAQLGRVSTLGCRRGVAGVSPGRRRGLSHGGERTLPGGEGTLPGGERALPRGERTLAGGEGTLPGGEGTLPGGEGTLPGGEGTPPGGQTGGERGARVGGRGGGATAQKKRARAGPRLAGNVAVILDVERRAPPPPHSNNLPLKAGRQPNGGRSGQESWEFTENVPHKSEGSPTFKPKREGSCQSRFLTHNLDSPHFRGKPVHGGQLPARPQRGGDAAGERGVERRGHRRRRRVRCVRRRPGEAREGRDAPLLRAELEAELEGGRRAAAQAGEPAVRRPGTSATTRKLACPLPDDPERGSTCNWAAGTLSHAGPHKQAPARVNGNPASAPFRNSPDFSGFFQTLPDLPGIPGASLVRQAAGVVTFRSFPDRFPESIITFRSSLRNE
eukprot:gene2741-biopygen12509